MEKSEHDERGSFPPSEATGSSALAGLGLRFLPVTNPSGCERGGEVWFDSNRKGAAFHVLSSSQRVSGYKQRRSCWDLCSTSSLRNSSALMEGIAAGRGQKRLELSATSP